MGRRLLNQEVQDRLHGRKLRSFSNPTRRECELLPIVLRNVKNDTPRLVNKYRSCRKYRASVGKVLYAAGQGFGVGVVLLVVVVDC